MTADSRDEFTTLTKTALALRAGYRCSFAGCGKVTVGPSDESETAHASIGVAAHICAAAPGGRRYDTAMTREGRRDIANGIWLCADHATLIDRDEISYSVASLRKMKRAHEERCIAELGVPLRSVLTSSDLFAIGPDIVCVGDLTLVENSSWTLKLRHFVMGDIPTLINFIGTFEQRRADDRYVILNELGDGRLLLVPPSLARVEDGYELQCQLQAPFPRIDAADLPTEIALSEDDFLMGPNGDFVTISGIAALEQKIRLSLSLQRGDDKFHPMFGARLVEYYEAFRGSPWLDNLLKLDVIRLAAIPYADTVSGQTTTPLHCVNRVVNITVDDNGTSNVLSLRAELDVKGVGSRLHNVRIRL